MSTAVQQNRAQAGADIIGRDKITINSQARLGKVESLMIKLKEQMDCSDTAKDTMQKLARHYEIIAEDGISGLEKSWKQQI